MKSSFDIFSQLWLIVGVGGYPTILWWQLNTGHGEDEAAKED